MPPSILRNRYLLSEAFELVGRHLFGDEWLGNELDAPSSPSPDELRAERAPWQTKLDEIDAQTEAVRSQVRQKLLSEAESRCLESQIEKLQAKRQQVCARLFAHPEPTDSHIWSYDRYRRRKTAEANLIGAIKEGKFPVWGHMGIDPWLWSEPYFHYDIELSIVRVPRTFSSKRHQPARIDELPFNRWLETLTRLNPSPPPTTPEDRCSLFLRGEITNGGKRMKRDKYCEQALNKIPGLSAEGFLRVWNSVAPESWKRPGRPRGKNR